MTQHESISAPNYKTQTVRELQDKQTVDSAFLIKFSQIATDKSGRAFMMFVFADKTGEVEARLWDRVEAMATFAVQDAFVRVVGKVQLYQGRKQIVCKDLQYLREDEVNPADYLVETKLDVEALHRQLLGFVESMKDPYYRALCEAVLCDDAEIVDLLKRAPAAKSLHHAYKGGLLEHVVSIAGILDALSRHYGSQLDRDLLLVGGFFHDIGKLWELSFERTVDYTTEGRLIGHHVIGVELIERKIQALSAESGRLPGVFPEDKRLLAKHVVLAHHGLLEYGSPKRPKCLEALVVHMVDDLDSKMNGIGRFIESDLNPGKWTALNRQHERYFYKMDKTSE